jgi:hypothetical protein
MAENTVAKTIVLRIKLFRVAELTSWGFTFYVRLFLMSNRKSQLFNSA